MYKRLVFPLMTRLEPEKAHGLTTKLLQITTKWVAVRRLLRRRFNYQDPRLEVRALELVFPNPLGLAAGFDKNAELMAAIWSFGFGHEEVGTIPPLPQPGNPKPRLFRLAQDKALINRLGFNSAGSDVATYHLLRDRIPGMVLGVNVGANKESVESGRAVDDYVTAIDKLGWFGHYITINVSSPNTVGLRDLQAKEALVALLDRAIEARDNQAPNRPVLVKISPDLTWNQLDDVLDVAMSRKVGGVIATNTTVSRPDSLRSSQRSEVGGLSGRPLAAVANGIIRYIYQNTNGRLPIIGVGGIFTWEDALEKIEFGASLVQTYTGFVYEGPSMAKRVNKGLATFLGCEGVDSIQDLVGSAVR